MLGNIAEVPEMHNTDCPVLVFTSTENIAQLDKTSNHGAPSRCPRCHRRYQPFRAGSFHMVNRHYTCSVAWHFRKDFKVSSDTKKCQAEGAYTTRQNYHSSFLAMFSLTPTFTSPCHDHKGGRYCSNIKVHQRGSECFVLHACRPCYLDSG
jgi:hypothetical protein